MAQSAKATCILGHTKRFRGLFVMRRFDRWWVKHQHPDYEVTTTYGTTNPVRRPRWW